MSLSSLIVQRDVATMRQVEEALARQVIYGGDLVTNLLEVARIDEGVLVALLAESMRLAPCPPGPLPEAPERVTALVPREIAVERTLVPLEIQDDGKLVLAVAEPLSHELEDQLRFSLGMGIEQRAAPAVRVQEAVSRAYGVPLERRMLRLIARLSGAAYDAGSLPPLLGVAPTVSEPPRPRSSPSITRVMTSPPLGAPSVVGQLAPRSPGHRTTSTGFPAVRQPVALEPARAPEAPAFEAAPRPEAAAKPEATPRPEAAPALEAAPVPEAAPVAEAAPVPEATPAHAPALRSAPTQRGTPAAAHAVVAPTPAAATHPVARPAAAAPSALLQRESAAPPRPARRRRGPITVEAATHEAEEAEDRDALLDIFFDFSQQFFDYSALFLVHGDIAEGRDAFGAGAKRERVLGIGVPLDLPSMVSTAREQRLPVIAKAPADGLDAVLLADLYRGRESEMAIVPLIVRTRAVALLVGDCGESGIDRAAVQHVVAFSAVVGKAFERIIVRRKLSGFMAGAVESRAGQVPSSSVPSKTAVSSAPPAARTSTAPVPFVSKLPKRASPSKAPGSTGMSSGMPPPAANVATVRKIAGPPIPREEPEAPGAVHATIQTSPPPRAPGKTSSPPNAPAQESPSKAPPPPAPSRTLPRPSHAPIPREEPAEEPDASPELDVVELHVQTGHAVAEGALFDELGWVRADPPDTELPSSAAVAVAAHWPPAPVTPSVELPTVIVDDLDRDLTSMVDRLASGEIDEAAEGELLRQGERAMRALMARFPGPIAFSRARIATATIPPKASECGPILRLVARERRVALPFVLEQLTSADADVRGWATHLVCELPYADAIPHLVARLRDVDASTRVSAAHALVAVSRSSPALVRDALIVLAQGEAAEDRVSAMAVMAKLREAAFVPDLIHALGDGDDRVVAAAYDALSEVARQDFGTDARPWLRWWEQNSDRHRIEWLIDALTHDAAEVRKSAAEELRSLTKEYFGYAGDLPLRDRDRAQQRYRDWWTMEGRTRFRQS